MLAHSPAFWQLAPVGLGPHEPAVQGFAPAHWVLSVHVVWHDVASLQTKGSQVEAVGVTHVPCPSHLETGVNELFAELQTAGLHSVLIS